MKGHLCAYQFTLTLAVLSTVSLFATSSEAEPSSLADRIETISPSVVGVGTAYPTRTPTNGQPSQRLLGSGFAVESSIGSFIVTNAHVVFRDLDSERREHLAIFIGSGKKVGMRFARLVAEDTAHDLALLKYDGPQLPPLELAKEVARPGDRVAFTGFPIGAVLGLYAATHEGIVSAITPIARPVNRSGDLNATQLRRLRTPFDVYQLDAIAYPGNSGSAVYRQHDGKVIGVMNSVYVKESREELLSQPSGIAYAIPSSHLAQLLEGVRN